VTPFWAPLSLVLLAILPVATGEIAPGAARPRPLVGAYSLVTMIEKPSRVVTRGTLVIDTYDPSSGKIAGYGVAQGVPASMTGTVDGSTITMHVVDRQGTALDRGRIGADGTIKGAIRRTSRVGQSGTWTMRPLLVTLGKVGLTVGHLGRRLTTVEYGIEVRNTSSTRDAIRVSVDIRPLSKSGELVAADQGALLVLMPIPAVPAGQTFYLGGEATLLGTVPVAKLRVTVLASSTPLKRFVLPPVSNVRLDSRAGSVTATVTNTYATALRPENLVTSTVLYDHAGRIIGGAYMPIFDAPASIEPGRGASFTALRFGSIPLTRIGSARVTVAPH